MAEESDDVTINCVVPKWMAERLDKMAADHRQYEGQYISRSAMVRLCLADCFRREDEENAAKNQPRKPKSNQP